MRKVLFFFVMAFIAIEAWSQDEPNNPTIGERPVIFNGTGHPHRLIEGWYYHDSHMLTVEFPATDFEPYTLSVSSTLTTLDYYVTTPYVCVPIMLTGLTYDIQLETDAGDVYWGVLDLSEATSME